MKRITNEREAGRLIGRVKTLYQAKDSSMERSKTKALAVEAAKRYNLLPGVF